MIVNCLRCGFVEPEFTDDARCKGCNKILVGVPIDWGRLPDSNTSKTFQFKVVYYGKDDEVIKSQIQEVPMDNKSHWSKVVKEEEV